MKVLPAKRQEENCTRRYSKVLRNQNEEHFCESNNLYETQVYSLYFILYVESTNNRKVKVNSHRVIEYECIWEEISFINS